MEDNDFGFVPVVEEVKSGFTNIGRAAYNKRFLEIEDEDNEENFESNNVAAAKVENKVESNLENNEFEEDEFLSDKDLKKKTKIKVYGEEKEVDLETLIKKVQIAEAAEKKLQDAAIKEKELEEVKKKYSELLEQQLAEKIQKDNKEEVDPTLNKDGLKKALTSLTEYDVDTAEELLKKEFEEIVERRINATKQPTKEVNVEEITKTIKTQLEVESAYKSFVNNNPDLQGNEYIDALMNLEMQKLSASGLSFADALEASSKNVRKFLKIEKTSEVKKTDDGLDELRAKKQAAKSIAVNQKGLNTKQSNGEDEVVNSRDLYFNLRKKAR